jgi:hypothetical protein
MDRSTRGLRRGNRGDDAKLTAVARRRNLEQAKVGAAAVRAGIGPGGAQPNAFARWRSPRSGGSAHRVFRVPFLRGDSQSQDPDRSQFALIADSKRTRALTL